MTTAFQSNAFQSDAFQILGGQTGAGNGQYLSFVLDDISATINQGLEHTQALSFTLDDISITINQLSSNAPVATVTSGGIGKKRQRLIIVDVDGTEYRVPESKLASFLDAIPKKVAEVKAKSKVKAKAERFEPVKLEIISAPIELISRINTDAIYAELKANQLFLQAAIRYQQEIDDEEAILLLM
jgi:hypothetical protein